MIRLIAIIAVIAVLIVALIVVAVMGIVRNAGTRGAQSSLPVLTTESRVVAKRTMVTGGGGTMASTTYYATFEGANGARMELGVDPTAYGQLAEGDWGQLTFQGARYISFARRGQISSPTDLR